MFRQQIQLAIEQLNHAQGLVPGSHWNGRYGLNLEVWMFIRKRGPVRIKRDIRNYQWISGCRHPSRNSLAERYPQPLQALRVLSDRDRIIQFSRFIVHHQQRPALRPEELGHLIHDGSKNLFQFEARSQRARNVMEHSKVIHLTTFDHFKLPPVLQSFPSSKCAFFCTFQISASHSSPNNSIKTMTDIPRQHDSSADVNHTARWFLKARLPNVMTRFFAHYDHAYIRSQLVICSASQHLPVKIMISLRKQTRPYLSVRGQPHSTTMPAEGTRHRRNNPYLSHSIVKGEPLRRLASCIWCQLHQWTVRIQPLYDLVHRYD